MVKSRLGQWNNRPRPDLHSLLVPLDMSILFLLRPALVSLRAASVSARLCRHPPQLELSFFALFPRRLFHSNDGFNGWNFNSQNSFDLYEAIRLVRDSPEFPPALLPQINSILNSPNFRPCPTPSESPLPSPLLPDFLSTFDQLRSEVKAQGEIITSLQFDAFRRQGLLYRIVLPQALAMTWIILSHCYVRGLELRHLGESDVNVVRREVNVRRLRLNGESEGTGGERNSSKNRRAIQKADWQVLDVLNAGIPPSTISNIEFLKRVCSRNEMFADLRQERNGSRRLPLWLAKSPLTAPDLLSPSELEAFQYVEDCFHESGQQ